LKTHGPKNKKFSNSIDR